MGNLRLTNLFPKLGRFSKYSVADLTGIQLLKYKYKKKILEENNHRKNVNF